MLFMPHTDDAKRFLRSKVFRVVRWAPDPRIGPPRIGPWGEASDPKDLRSPKLVGRKEKLSHLKCLQAMGEFSAIRASGRDSLLVVVVEKQFAFLLIVV